MGFKIVLLEMDLIPVALLMEPYIDVCDGTAKHHLAPLVLLLEPLDTTDVPSVKC